jgi:hypothetical protein
MKQVTTFPGVEEKKAMQKIESFLGGLVFDFAC